MSRFHVLKILAATPLVAAGAALLIGCGSKPGIVLGPKPAVYAREDAAKNQMVDDMRAWLEALSPEDAEALVDTGELAFPYDELQASDPEHAQMVADYLRNMHARRTEEQLARLRGAGFEPPEGPPQSVSFIRGQRGDCEMRFEFEDGSFSNLILADPL